MSAPIVAPPQMTDHDFAWFAAEARRRIGIQLTEAKRDLVYNRLAKRLRAVGARSFSEYRKILAQDEKEAEHFLSALTTNVTSFFRENHHFEILSERVLSKPGPVKIWSCGCSTGEEPYSIAMTLLESGRDGKNSEVIASDIDPEVLAKAKKAVYSLDRITDVSEERRHLFFLKGVGKNSGVVAVRKGVRELIRFERVNIMEDWPVEGPLDAVFCRNVLIYFDVPTQRKVVERFSSLLRRGGVLFLGHSENAGRDIRSLRMVGHTAYEKVS